MSIPSVSVILGLPQLTGKSIPLPSSGQKLLIESTAGSKLGRIHSQQPKVNYSAVIVLRLCMLKLRWEEKTYTSPLSSMNFNPSAFIKNKITSVPWHTKSTFDPSLLPLALPLESRCISAALLTVSQFHWKVYLEIDCNKLKHLS